MRIVCRKLGHEVPSVRHESPRIRGKLPAYRRRTDPHPSQSSDVLVLMHPRKFVMTFRKNDKAAIRALWSCA